MASDYYPAGAYSDPSAPYKEIETPMRDFDVEVTETLTRSATVTTQRYVPEYDDENGCTYANTDDMDWKEVYSENFKPLAALLREMKEETDLFIEDIEQRIKVCDSRRERNLLKRRRRKLIGLAKNMVGWESSDINVVY